MATSLKLGNVALNPTILILYYNLSILLNVLATKHSNIGPL